MKKRFGDVTLEEFTKICHPRLSCVDCPLAIGCKFHEKSDFDMEVDLDGSVKRIL